MKRIRMAVLAGTAAAGLVLTACGGDANSNDASDNTSGRGPRAAATTTLAAAETTTLGTVVTDSQGRTLYRFDNDTAVPSASNCLADCAVKWPPALVGKGQNVRLDGVDQSLVGSVARPDGSLQLTLAGWPLYQFAKDQGPGDTLGQGVGDVWFAATPQGSRAKATEEKGQPEQPAGTGDAGGDGGGYGY